MAINWNEIIKTVDSLVRTRLRIRCPDTREDAVQDVLLLLVKLRILDRYDEARAKLATYLWPIVYLYGLARRRKLARRDRLLRRGLASGRLRAVDLGGL